MGTEVFNFERELEAFIGGGRRVVCTSSGTTALQLAMQACDIGQGDEVLVPSLTYLASFQAISATGASPIACDVNILNGLIDLDDVERRITGKSKAIMPVHYTGYSGDLRSIYKFAKTHSLRVIEDAAHAFGSLHQGERIGSFGDVTCFSFDGIKNITCGEGGAIVTADKSVFKISSDLRLLAIEGDSEKRYSGKRSWNFDVKDQGWRYHMSDIMAAIGRVQLRRFPSEIAPKRRELVEEYRQRLSSIPWIGLFENMNEDVVPHIFVVRILDGSRDLLRERLGSNGIETGLHYQPNHYLSKYGGRRVHLPVTDRLYDEMLTLPLHPALELQDVELICDSILKFH